MGFGTIEPRGVNEKGKPNRWRPKYTYLGMTHYGTTVRKESFARQWLDDEEKLIILGEWTPPKARMRKAKERRDGKKKRLVDFATAFIDERRDAGLIVNTTHANYETLIKNNIEPFLQDTTLADWNEEACRKWWSDLTSSKKTPTTARRAADLLSSVSDLAVELELIEKNPIPLVKATRARCQLVVKCGGKRVGQN